MSLERGVPEAAATELRRAFYAGADLLLTTILHNLTSGSAAEDADVTLLKDVQADIERFAREVAEGRR
jgi:hypothetical protein